MQYHPWLPNLKYVNEMLKEIGVSSIDELFKDIPEEIKLKKLLNVGYGKPLSEYEIYLRLQELKSKNKQFIMPPFLGGGACQHYVPEAVKFIISRSEFYTSYTPYQPEINQGLLQALFEYQSLISDLLEMDVVNSSLYDWGGALAEAALMAYRINGKKKILVPKSINPNHKKVLETWTGGRELEIQEIDYDNNGEIDLNKLENAINDDVSAIYIQQPNYFGIFETKIEEITDLAKKKGIITIMGVNPLSLGLIKPPGEYDIDIAIGDGQELGLPLNYGGPYVGILATKWDYKFVRQMPGRIVGLTEDKNGNPGFTLILQTREQFARREKATSNITTNEALMAIANAVYLSLLGKNGLEELSKEIYKRSHYTENLMEKNNLGKRKFYGDFFEEFLFSFYNDYSEIHKKLLSKGIHGGLALNNNDALFCVTEVHTKAMIEKFVNTLVEVSSNVHSS
ncbi:aminomethyl-transferring glycine dehydrogenase subunit GcvPA [Acidianus sulfidivorans JP7]|uniref:Probable glycine dehydrogenase (decarboxylating) subunit 1 n=1 Tax=Acidianus sulfidivorans JP7 TaxID=619593 RepID=A0A2U9INW8_9CREN|nr:aminomethyl-transferring glycine dehydrogenase subunit GcvPA [Acidianus sulfidivorans]AWR97738.1 aminomethyl-transferring glycine dehydrogenase subunit GcvPA [Acidianus sulfidivorans JP7]